MILQHTTLPPLTETLLKQLKERKHALREKERELGEIMKTPCMLWKIWHGHIMK
jgi:hypothetical protein